MMKKSQTCPFCLINEALGSYCTKCLRPTQPSWVRMDTKRGRRIFPAAARSTERPVSATGVSKDVPAG